MGRRVPGRNKWLGLLAGAWIACQPSPEVNHYIDARTVQIESREGSSFIQNKPITGVLFSINTQGDTLFRVPFFGGKENGKALFFYPGNRIREERFFVNGWKEGTHRGWYENGRPMFEYHFHDDLFESSYREWFPNGKLFRNMHYEKGQESGVQQSWSVTGTIKMNYVIKNDRRYGLLGTKNCRNISAGTAGQ
ncbi:toxin-antitoxin system YwqK family antitoxin [Spirosoma koreense]